MPPGFRFPSDKRMDSKCISELPCLNDNGMGCVRGRMVEYMPDGFSMVSSIEEFQQ